LDDLICFKASGSRLSADELPAFDAFIRTLSGDEVPWEQINRKHDARIMVTMWMRTWNRELDLSSWLTGSGRAVSASGWMTYRSLSRGYRLRDLLWGAGLNVLMLPWYSAELR